MRKNYLVYLFIGVLALLGIYSCSNDTPEVLRISKGEKICLKVGMPTEGSKANSRVAFNDGNLSLTWQNGDQLALVGYDQAGKFIGKSVLSMDNPAAGTNETTFSGYTVEGAQLYDIYYPAKGISEKGEIVIDYDNQAQTGNNNTAHLRDVILLKQTKGHLSTDDLVKENAQTTLQMQNTIVKFVVQNLGLKNPAFLIWEIIGKDGKIFSKTLGITKPQISDKTFTGYISIPSMSIDAQTVSVYMQEETKAESNENSPIYYYTSDVKKVLNYLPNTRPTATITNGELGHKIFYTCNVQLNKEMFNSKLLGGLWNPESGKGYMVTTSDRVAMKKDDKNKDKIERLDIIGIYAIGNSTFESYSNSLKQITLNKGIQEIGNKVFFKCQNLEKITLPEGLITIGEDAFNGCVKINTISLPNSLQSIGNSAFENCNGLKEIIIPANVTRMGKNVFLHANNLQRVTILAIEPPTIIETLGSISNVEFYVPSASLEKYKGSTGWSSYKEHIHADGTKDKK